MNQIQLISDLFYDPLIENDAFNEKIVKQKKKELKERLQVNKDDKFSYSLDKLFEYMGHDDVLGISSTGYEDDIEAITAKDLYQYLLKCIREDEKHLYVVGDVDESIVNIFQKYLQLSLIHIFQKMMEIGKKGVLALLVESSGSKPVSYTHLICLCLKEMEIIIILILGQQLCHVVEVNQVMLL